MSISLQARIALLRWTRASITPAVKMELCSAEQLVVITLVIANLDTLVSCAQRMWTNVRASLVKMKETAQIFPLDTSNCSLNHHVSIFANIVNNTWIIYVKNTWIIYSDAVARFCCEKLNFLAVFKLFQWQASEQSFTSQKLCSFSVSCAFFLYRHWTNFCSLRRLSHFDLFCCMVGKIASDYGLRQWFSNGGTKKCCKGYTKF